jgi:hypothetical protein
MLALVNICVTLIYTEVLEVTYRRRMYRDFTLSQLRLLWVYLGKSNSSFTHSSPA